MIVDWQHAFILHRRPYREQSLLLDLFTQEQGKISVIAKGALSRSRANLKGILQPFIPLLVTYGGKSTLKTLHKSEALSLALPLTQAGLYYAIYVNELLIRVLYTQIICPKIFIAYLRCLKMLAKTPTAAEIIVVRFEFFLLSQLGHAVNFQQCALTGLTINYDQYYYFHPDKGFIVTKLESEHNFTGSEINAFATQKFLLLPHLKAARRFLNQATRAYFGINSLNSTQLIF